MEGPERSVGFTRYAAVYGAGVKNANNLVFGEVFGPD